ncbi:DUF2303 family protein [Variovorax atrisoli]|uniref:DUF2303 family protein n=1 Tax=Variovorax atrisoli TaxID=3394203 RepID=UPI00160A2B3A|nr:DUF2303 family protein [Variovorax sp. BK613]MBB3642582.1 uncharacterized protein YfdQ (DUF2303 family) [Variovorax sp. BK613]
MDQLESLAVEEVARLATAGLEPKRVANTVHLVVPERYKHVDITELVRRAELAPQRKSGTVQLGDLNSLLQYMADQGAQELGYVYADPERRTITAVFNDQKAGPGWRDHRAEYTAALTPEAKRWLDNDGKELAQMEFAEFVEDNLADLNGTEGETLLSVATTIVASTGISFSSARRLDNGQTQLLYSENIDARAGENGALVIPKTFTLGLRLFKNGEGYKLTARLKYRLHGQAVKFRYELDRPEKALEDAFAGYVEQVRNAKVGEGDSARALGYTVLTGKV